jgi:hypothetical protein
MTPVISQGATKEEWNTNMLANYCLMIKREAEKLKRKRIRKSIKEKKEVSKAKL